MQKISDFRKNQHFFCKNPEISQNFCNFLRFFAKFATFSKNQLDSFVDLEKPEKMRIWLQNFVSIQPRTSLEKSDVSWPTELRPTPQEGLPAGAIRRDSNASKHLPVQNASKAVIRACGYHHIPLLQNECKRQCKACRRSNPDSRN